MIKIFLLISAAICFNFNVKAIQNCQTSNCHSEMKSFRYTHKPLQAKGCTICHQIVDEVEANVNKKLPENHPLVALKINDDQGQVCLLCHVEWGKKMKAKPHPHSAIQKNGCTGCHNPHGADNKKFLKEKLSNYELCIRCHKKNENWEMGDNKDNAHRSMNVKNKCFNCHEVHSSKLPKLLKHAPQTLCQKCHEDTIPQIEDKNLMHTPVRNGECLKCHSPHFSSEENMLNQKTEKSCMTCHEVIKSQDTKFMNENKNLHKIHEGSLCNTCHDPHLSSQAMLMKKKSGTKKNPVTITYLKTKTGGNCTTSCHIKKEYIR